MTQNEIAELRVQKDLTKHVDDFNSFRFNAGAGAGKTYALIETLKYVIANKITATKSPQKVACITYTNVAVDEIKSRLGNSDIVHVSTIHERLWEIIKRAQPQLLILHKGKVEEAVKDNNQKLYSSEKAQFFTDLDNSQQLELIQFVIQTKDVFYQSKNLKAEDFKSAYKDCAAYTKPVFFGNCLKNVGNFKYVAGLLYKNQRLEECLERIVSGKEKRVSYDSKVNSDRLHYMKFSHDTLLGYGLKLVKTYPTLCRLIIDSYPYFFIDEYQDTHRSVVEFVKTIHDYSIKTNNDWMVGYFGDTAQSIYEDGVGRNIKDLHNRLTDVDKIFNRRSHQKIIDVANNIRDDEIIQVPISEDRNNGSVHFFYNDSGNRISTAQQFLEEYKNDLITSKVESVDKDSVDTKIHCLVLTNKLMASFNGFEEVYDVYSKSTIYYNDLKTQGLSHQLEKLHPTVLTIYHFVKLYQDIQRSMVSYYDIFGISSKNMRFSKASLVIRELETETVSTFKDWIDLIIDRIENSGAKNALGKMLINRINYEQDRVDSADALRSTLFDSINTLMNEGSEGEIKAKEKINSVLSLPITSLINWANFIDGIEADDIIYHTCHGTKGEEYENVAIILEHSFGRMGKDKFRNYFNLVQQNMVERERLLSDPEIEEKHINTQNLLYVACSRAIRNLRVLYLDDILELEDGIKSIFGGSRHWPSEGSHINSGNGSPKVSLDTTQDLTPNRFCELKHLKSMWSQNIRRKQQLIVPVSRLEGEHKLLNGEDWLFNVPFAFRSALDITYVERKKEKKPYMVWTQGPILSFKEGDTLHSRDGAAILQVQNANSMGWDSATNSMYEGTIYFDVYKNIGGKISKVKNYTCTQMEFLEILIVGKFGESNIVVVDSKANC